MPGSAASPLNPQSWVPFSSSYAMQPKAAASPSPVAQDILLKHAMDDTGVNASTFISMDVNFGVDNLATPHTNDWNFLFPLNDPSTFNSALGTQGSNWTEPNHPAGYSIVDGIGGQGWQKFPKFETLSLPLVDNTQAGQFAYSARVELDGIDNTLQVSGTFVLQMQATNDFSIRENNLAVAGASDYLLAGAAITPQDIRIEASVYSEEGSFFVIPWRLRLTQIRTIDATSTMPR